MVRMRFIGVASIIAATISSISGLKLDSLRDATIQEQISSSPLHIHLQYSNTPGNVRAVITNRGLSTAHFSTWRNPLSTNERVRTVDVLTAAEDSEFVSFLHSEGFVSQQDAPKDYETLLPGASVSRDINILTNYDVQLDQEYFIFSNGFIPYYLEGQSSDQSLWAAYETNILPFTISKEATASVNDQEMTMDAASRYINTGCPNPEVAKRLNKAIPIAAKMAKEAADAVSSGGAKEAFQAYFKTDNAETRKTVAARFNVIHQTLTSSKGPYEIGCRGSCTGMFAGGIAWTNAAGMDTFFCPAMTKYPDDVVTCFDGSFPGVLIHELTHSGKLYAPSTGDRAQGAKACKALSASQAIRNADNFNMFAQSVYLKKVC